MGAIEDYAAAIRPKQAPRTLVGTVAEVIDATHVRVSIGDRAVAAFGVAPVGARVSVNVRGDNLCDLITVLPGAWTAPTLAGSWVNFGSDTAPAGYRLNGDTVEMRGMIKNGSGLIFTLPAGMRPTAGVIRALVPAGPGAAIVDARWDGPVNLVSYLASGTNAQVSLSGLLVPLA